MRMTDSEQKQPEMEPEELGNEAGSQAMDAALQSSFVILKVVIAVLVVYLIFSNTFTVEDKKEGAIILSFGKSRTSAEDVWKPGLRFAWPFPIEERVVIKVVSPVTSDFFWTQYPPKDLGIPDDDPSSNPKINASNPGHGYLLTKDNKAIHLKADMRYVVNDFDRFVFGFYDKDDEEDEPGAGAKAILEYILESALTHAAYERTLEEILNPNRIPKEASDRDTFRKKVENRVKQLMEQYDLGVKLKGSVTINFGNTKELESIPTFARKSRKDYTEQATVSFATTEAAKTEAKAVRQSIQENSGELAIIAEQAEKERQELIDSLEAIAERFNSIHEKFPKPADRYRRMEELYYQVITRIAQNKDVKIYLVPKGDENQPTRLRIQINQPPPERSKK